MKMSELYIPALHQAPRDAEVMSHQYLIRGGFIRKVAAGIFHWLPLGLKVLKKVSQVVHEEMQAIGAQEVWMPAIQPAELWQETGRWEEYGHLLLKMADRHDRDFCFGPTHEEVICDLMRLDLKSYKSLPIVLYQIQIKFRDELRPRFGILRAREFLMKDAYSFHLDTESLSDTYQNMYEAYCNIFTRLGLNFRAVSADSGEIGGACSHEFHVLAQTGEDVLAYSTESTYAANIEAATLSPPKRIDLPQADAIPLGKVTLPNCPSVSTQAQALHVGEEQILKMILVKGVETPVVGLLLRGDHTLSLTKAAKHPWLYSPLTLIDLEKDLPEWSSRIGSIGPIDTIWPLIADYGALTMQNFFCGANEKDMQFSHVYWGRDLPVPEVSDLREVVAGDPSPDGQGKLALCRGIEVGHIFQLGTRYSAPMNLSVLNGNGEQQPVQMGCYGIGVSRIVAAAIEQHHDADGIIWPQAMSPFDIVLIPLGYHQSQRIHQATEALYQRLLASGFDVLLEDSDERPGALFAKADLMGIPHRLVLGNKQLDGGCIEYKSRCSTENLSIPEGELIEFLNQQFYPQAKSLEDSSALV